MTRILKNTAKREPTGFQFFGPKEWTVYQGTDGGLYIQISSPSSVRHHPNANIVKQNEEYFVEIYRETHGPNAGRLLVRE